MVKTWIPLSEQSLRALAARAREDGVALGLKCMEWRGDCVIALTVA